MQNLIERYKAEIKRYNDIISNENSTEEDIKHATYFRGKASGFLEDIRKGNLKLS